MRDSREREREKDSREIQERERFKSERCNTAREIDRDSRGREGENHEVKRERFKSAR